VFTDEIRTCRYIVRICQGRIPTAMRLPILRHVAT
jgi:hypothetical protein